MDIHEVRTAPGAPCRIRTSNVLSGPSDGSASITCLCSMNRDYGACYVPIVTTTNDRERIWHSLRTRQFHVQSPRTAAWSPSRNWAASTIDTNAGQPDGLHSP